MKLFNFNKEIKFKRQNFANRGMKLEKDIISSCEFYQMKNIASISKRPTPINVIEVDYSKNAKITEAYFEQQSTTDFNGVYKSYYIDFEAKSVQSTTSFPLSNIHTHQLKHLTNVIDHGGIAFFIIEFSKLNKIYAIDALEIINFCNINSRKSLTIEYLNMHAMEIKRSIFPPIDFIKYVDLAIKKRANTTYVYRNH